MDGGNLDGARQADGARGVGVDTGAAGAEAERGERKVPAASMARVSVLDRPDVEAVEDRGISDYEKIYGVLPEVRAARESLRAKLRERKDAVPPTWAQGNGIAVTFAEVVEGRIVLTLEDGTKVMAAIMDVWRP